jgi:hypothetical protein
MSTIGPCDDLKDTASSRRKGKNRTKLDDIDLFVKPTAGRAECALSTNADTCSVNDSNSIVSSNNMFYRQRVIQ